MTTLPNSQANQAEAPPVGAVPQVGTSVVSSTPLVANNAVNTAVAPVAAVAPADPAAASPTAEEPLAVRPAAITPESAAPVPVEGVNEINDFMASHQGAVSEQSTNSNSVMGMTDLVQAVIQKGLMTNEKLVEVNNNISAGRTVEESLVQAGVSEDNVYRTKAEMFNIEYVDVSSLSIDPNILHKLPVDAARKYQAVAIEQTAEGLKVAMVDPLDIQKIKFLGVTTGSNIVPVFSSPAMITYVIDNKYGAEVGAEVQEALAEVGDNSQIGQVITEVTDLDSSGDLANAPVSKIVNMMLEYSIRYKSSDIHIEPRENKISVRFRIFGVLTEKLTLPKKLHPSVVSRIKILSNLKIDEHRVPQDGRFQVKMGTTAVDLRVSVIPTVYGEKIVMRLLEKGGGAMDLPDTGMRGHALKLYTESLRKTQGIILVTGPTGSGKTQTLASSLKILNTPAVNIMTLEDPVEIRMDGVNQVQVNADVGLTFARGLRAFLRQDPDIIMVGEIRDGETAELAVQAALVGRLVLATLHTNSAAGAIPRLIDMGIEPFLLASTLNITVAQRLVRKICEDCKEAYYADKAIVTEIHKILDGLKGSYDMYKLPNNDAGDLENIEDDKLVLYRGKGCPKCNDTGYQGRLGIFEALDVNEKISKGILQRSSTMDLNRTAIENGMITMVQDGFMKALEGLTTIEEVLRVQQD